MGVVEITVPHILWEQEEDKNIALSPYQRDRLRNNKSVSIMVSSHQKTGIDSTPKCHVFQIYLRQQKKSSICIIMYNHSLYAGT
jgi:hypothetical protein